jgi:glutaredoxin
MDLMDDILMDVEAKSRSLDSVFKIGPNEEKKIRFLCEGSVGLSYDFHGRFVKGQGMAKYGWSVPCPVSFKKYARNKKVETYNKTNCPYCQFADDKATSTKTDKKFAWLIWNYTDGCVQVFTFKISDKTPVTKLAKKYKRFGTLLDRDYIVSKGSGDFPATDIDSDDKGDFIITSEMKQKGCVVPKTDVEAQKKILELMAKAWCPALLSLDTEFVLPEHHRPDAVMRTEKEETEATFADEDMLPAPLTDLDDGDLEDLDDDL